MSDANSVGDRSSRRSKRFLSPSQKSEIWLQLVRQEVTIAEAAVNHRVGRTTIMRIRTVAKECALAALAASKPGTAARQRDYELGGRQDGKRAAVRGAQGDGRAADPDRGKRAVGLCGRVPRRVDAATKTVLLDLLDHAVDAGWTLRRACHELELGEVRAHRWIARRAQGQLADKTPGGSPVHGLLEEEAAEILALFDEWGETGRSHRKLAHRGPYLHRVWVSASSVRRVLFLADKHLRPLPKPGRSQRKPFPDWVDYTPNSIWIYDTTHFARAGMAALVIQGPALAHSFGE